MGASQSTAQTYGFHVLTVWNGVQRASPAEEGGIEPFFDYLCAINNIRLDTEDTKLTEELKNNLNQEVNITVYSSKTQEFRETIIVPSNNWGGVGLLGARVRYCNFEEANEHVWHILDIYPSSPAAKAGLKAHVDYVVSSPEALLHDQNAFSDAIQQSNGKPLRLYVYNSESDTLREVTITPDKNWGGAGSLGCDVAYGMLHRIPIRQETRTPRRPSDRALVGPNIPVAPTVSNELVAVAATPDGFAEVPLIAAGVPSSPEGPTQDPESNAPLNTLVATVDTTVTPTDTGALNL